jgi:pimeloyl-ACP methyl ester carboxylesterase
MKKQCMLIPGNPAVAEYYQEWIGEIEAANPDLEITYASSYVLFDKKLDYAQYDQALREYYGNILLGLSSIRSSSEESAGQQVTIFAHSAGAYFALRLLEKFPEKIEKVVILFPYIGYSKYFLMHFVYVPYIIDRFAPLVEFISKYKNILLARTRYIREISSEQLKANLRFGVRQCVYFNGTKFPTEEVAMSKDKIDFIYTEHDRWCPPVAINLLKKVSLPIKVALPHDFITTKEHRLKMIDILARL